MQRLSHINGASVVDDTNTQAAGLRGPAVLQNSWLLEKLARFTTASHFAAIGKQTEAFVRFSTVASDAVTQRHITHCTHADPNCGRGVRDALRRSTCGLIV